MKRYYQILQKKEQEGEKELTQHRPCQGARRGPRMNERAMFIQHFIREMITTRKLIKTQRKKIELRMKAMVDD